MPFLSPELSVKPSASQRVVSAHTHDFPWMPKKDVRSIARLVGGAPQPKFAKFLQETATKQELKLKMTKRDGAVVAEFTLPAWLRRGVEGDRLHRSGHRGS